MGSEDQINWKNWLFLVKKWLFGEAGELLIGGLLVFMIFIKTTKKVKKRGQK